ncbi:hypothetical protein RI129_008171 [Pyrocoelia pectoralis]|uniref:Uncharacterized protein n=1 Tax=Pyrocoelia pectoralis TaxID=417401 RepID=A0AAN7VEP5_9COLE
MEIFFEHSIKRHKDKFERLFQRSQYNKKPSLDINRIVINLSSKPLSENALNALAKGKNFAVTPKILPVEDIISNIEAGIRFLPVDTIEEIRYQSVRILRNAKPIKSNLTFSQRHALKELKGDKDVIVLSADKGNATVILNMEDYNMKLQQLLDPQIYKILPKDPTNKFLLKTKNLIKYSSIPDTIKRELTNTEAISPRLFTSCEAILYYS